jgi:preprotein translocase subunit SecB
MADSEEQPAAGQASATNEPGFAIRKIYVKDLSFECPSSPEVFTVEWSPDVDLQLHTAATQIGESDYEVTLTVTATVRVGELTAFLAEVQESGIFSISGVSQEQLGPMLGAYCPAVLFPYAREVISDVSVRGGFPQLVLAPVNFDALYARHGDEQGSAATAAD